MVRICGLSGGTFTATASPSVYGSRSFAHIPSSPTPLSPLTFAALAATLFASSLFDLSSPEVSVAQACYERTQPPFGAVSQFHAS